MAWKELSGRLFGNSSSSSEASAHGPRLASLTQDSIGASFQVEQGHALTGDFRTGSERMTGQRGFTLVETLIALPLFTVILLGTLAGIGTIIRINARGGETVRAMLLAQDKMEELRENDYAALTSGSDVEKGLSRSWTVVTGSLPNTRQVDVTVTWAIPEVGSTTLTAVISQ